MGTEDQYQFMVSVKYITQQTADTK